MFVNVAEKRKWNATRNYLFLSPHCVLRIFSRSLRQVIQLFLFLESSKRNFLLSGRQEAYKSRVTSHNSRNFFWIFFLSILANFFLFIRLPLALFSESRYISIILRFTSKQKIKLFDGVIGLICLPLLALTLVDAVPLRHHRVWVFYARFINFFFLVFGSFLFHVRSFLALQNTNNGAR